MTLILRYILLLLWVACLLISPILLFARGFLLNKSIVATRSTCESISEKCAHMEYLPKTEPVFYCIQSEVGKRLLFDDESKQFCVDSKNKVILMLIDALRFDFVAKASKNETIMPYHNKLTVISELLELNNAQLYKFIADPPTTTLQRINGLMTGSLPTFIDIGSNFASSEINEDNIIDQIVSHDKRIIFMGDDTWNSVFPGRFLRSYPYPSFNVWDLDTVDTGVKSQLVPEIKKNDWDMIIAHFLGVDHCGHRYGPNHPEMIRKLSEMNDVIQNVVSEIDNDTILIVIGDHGMTENGDHGGASYKEVTSAMFVYSPSRNLSSGFQPTDSVRQIDLTPTLAVLLGVPIPYSNLGTVILDVLPITHEESLVTNWNYILSVVWSNVLQTSYYIQEYSKQNSQFPSEVLSELINKFQSIKKSSGELKAVDEYKKVIDEGRRYLKSVLQMCEELWVQFNSVPMFQGLILMFMNLIVIFILVDSVPTLFFNQIIESNFLICGMVTYFFSAVITFVLHYKSIISNLELSLYFLTNAASLVVFIITISFNWPYIANELFNDKINVSNKINIIVLVTSLGLFSNSYIIEECCVISFLLATGAWLSFFKMKPPLNNSVVKFNFFSSIREKSLIFTVALNFLIRVSWFYWQCREEQTRQCYYIKSFPYFSLRLCTIIVWPVFIMLARYILRNLGNLTGFSFGVLLSKHVSVFCLICCLFYWVLDGLPVETRSKLFLPWQLLLLPRTVLCTSVIGIILLYFDPLSVHYISSSRRPQGTDKLIPALYHRLKGIMRKDAGMKGFPVVYGLATVYSAAFLNVAIFLSFISALLLGETRVPSVIILLVSISLMCVVIAAVRHSTLSKQYNLFSVPWWAVLCWGLSSINFFYGTGHQATFSGIQWESAFLVGEVVSTIVPGGLVLTNTFISQILHAFLLPFLFIMPFTLGVLWPASVTSSDLKRGELLMIEEDYEMRKGMFTLAIRYILFHAFRVFVSMLAACIHSRHLMVWKIFAPKLIFESVSFFITLLFVTLGFLLTERITVCTKRLIKKIEDDNR